MNFQDHLNGFSKMRDETRSSSSGNRSHSSRSCGNRPISHAATSRASHGGNIDQKYHDFLNGVKETNKQPTQQRRRARYATGGHVALTKNNAERLSKQGRFGDTKLAKVGTLTAKLMDGLVHGGHKQINPKTGLREYGKEQSKVTMPMNEQEKLINRLIEKNRISKLNNIKCAGYIPTYALKEKQQFSDCPLLSHANYTLNSRQQNDLKFRGDLLKSLAENPELNTSEIVTNLANKSFLPQFQKINELEYKKKSDPVKYKNEGDNGIGTLDYLKGLGKEVHPQHIKKFEMNEHNSLDGYNEEKNKEKTKRIEQTQEIIDLLNKEKGNPKLFSIGDYPFNNTYFGRHAMMLNNFQKNPNTVDNRNDNDSAAKFTLVDSCVGEPRLVTMNRRGSVRYENTLGSDPAQYNFTSGKFTHYPL